MHQEHFQKLRFQRIPMSNAVINKIMANEMREKNGRACQKDVEDYISIEQLNTMKAVILGGTMQVEAKELNTKLFSKEVQNYIVNCKLSCYATPLDEVHSIIYHYNTNSSQKKQSRDSDCPDLIFFDVVKTNIIDGKDNQHIKLSKGAFDFRKSLTKPNYGA
jgi:hypothetical protein